MRCRSFLAVVLSLLILLSAGAPARAEDVPAALRGYDRDAGYIYVSLGQYPQTAEGGVLPILWRVLTASDEKLYLLSEYILFARPMHPNLKEYRDVLQGDFGQTELCRYLNTTFAGDAFTQEELDMLLPCENFGKIFLLDRSEILDKSIGLGETHKGKTNTQKIYSEPGLRAWGTDWAIQNNGVEKKKERLYVFQRKYGACSPYWIRTQSVSDKRHAMCTKDGAQLGHIEVGRENEGVRPALYLAPDRFRIGGGSGTKEDPYLILPLEVETP